MKPTKKFKDIYNAWISPEGDLYECDYMGHNKWANEYFLWKNKGNRSKAIEEIEKIHGNRISAYPCTALEKLGWIRILTWSSKKTQLYGQVDSPNKEQKDTLMFWCSANRIDYEIFIKKYNGD